MNVDEVKMRWPRSGANETERIMLRDVHVERIVESIAPSEGKQIWARYNLKSALNNRAIRWSKFDLNFLLQSLGKEMHTLRGCRVGVEIPEEALANHWQQETAAKTTKTRAAATHKQA